MHEYSIVQAIVSKVEAEVRARGALRVHRLKVRVGELSGVDPGLLETAFRTFREGTVCAEASLEVQRVAVTWRCERCGREIGQGEVLRCGACGVPARLVAGDELFLDQIEMEVP